MLNEEEKQQINSEFSLLLIETIIMSLNNLKEFNVSVDDDNLDAKLKTLRMLVAPMNNALEDLNARD